MLVVDAPLLVGRIADHEVRRLVERPYAEICAGEPYNYEQHGQLILVQPGDTVEMLERHCGCFILSDFFGEFRFGDADFSPSYEALQDHASCYEMTFIFNDDGFGISLFVPKQRGIDAELLAMCAEYAVPARLENTST